MSWLTPEKRSLFIRLNEASENDDPFEHIPSAAAEIQNSTEFPVPVSMSLQSSGNMAAELRGNSAKKGDYLASSGSDLQRKELQGTHTIHHFCCTATCNANFSTKVNHARIGRKTF